MWKFLRPSKRNYIDQNKIAAKHQAENDALQLIEFGDENDAVAYAKMVNPKWTEEDIKKVVTLYRAAKASRAMRR